MITLEENKRYKITNERGESMEFLASNINRETNKVDINVVLPETGFIEADLKKLETEKNIEEILK